MFDIYISDILMLNSYFDFESLIAWLDELF